MATLFVHHKVQDYKAWRKVFDELTAMRTDYGCTGHKVFQAPSDPNEVTIISDWKSADRAKAYATSEDLKRGMQNAGVISQPDVMFLEEA